MHKHFDEPVYIENQQPLQSPNSWLAIQIPSSYAYTDVIDLSHTDLSREDI